MVGVPRRRCCLRREMSGSAGRLPTGTLGLSVCRGCRLHFMLRPACLLPAERLAPLHGLLTPRSGTEVSLHYLGPATRRTDAYRDGTLTRGGGAASQGRTTPFGIQFFLSVTTHHGCIVIGRCATPSPRVGGSLGRPVAAADRPSSEMRCRGALDSNQRPKNHRIAADARSFLHFSSSGSLALLQPARSSASLMDSQRSWAATCTAVNQKEVEQPDSAATAIDSTSGASSSPIRAGATGR